MSVCSGRHGHSSHGHSSHGHSGHGHSGHGHSGHGNTGDGSHHADGSSSSHVGSSGQSHHDSETNTNGQNHHNSETNPNGQNYHNSETNLDSQDHYNPDTRLIGGDSSDVHINDDGRHGHHSTHHNHHHHHNGHNNEAATTTSTTPTPDPKIDESWLELSCDKGMGNKYPRKRVASAVREMRKILSSDGGNSNVRNAIKWEVKTYFIMLYKPDYDTTIYRSTGCDEITSYIAPLGGCDIHGNPLIVVNVPDLQQVIKTSDCRTTFSFCNYADGSICLQSTRSETLLTLPAKQGSFNVTDFSVGTFKVHNGCQCLSSERINVNDFLPFGSIYNFN